MWFDEALIRGNSMKQIAIYGAGGFGREVAWLAESCDGGWQVVCFVQDNPALFGKRVNDIPVMSLEDATGRFTGAGIVSGIGSPKARETVMKKAVAAGFVPVSLIHPRAETARWIEMGEGVVICAGCILTTNIRIGNQVQINLDCTVGHDVVMGDYTTLAPGVHVSGWVHFGKRVYVGTGAVFINGTEERPLLIGDDVVIGAGACVTKSIDCGTWGGACQAAFPQNSVMIIHRLHRWTQIWKRKIICVICIICGQNLQTGLPNAGIRSLRMVNSPNIIGLYRTKIILNWVTKQISVRLPILMPNTG